MAEADLRLKIARLKELIRQADLKDPATGEVEAGTYDEDGNYVSPHALENIPKLKEKLACRERYERQAQYESGLFSALLADLVEVFGGDKKVPELLWYPHAGWACGPGQLKPGECYVEAWASLRKHTLKSEQVAHWKRFLVAVGRARGQIQDGMLEEPQVGS